MVVIGAATQLFASSAIVYIQQATPAAQRGLALSAYNAGFIGFVPAGAFLVAAIASTAGTRWALIGPGLAILACGTALTFRTTAPRTPPPRTPPRMGQEPESEADAAAA
jgi:MFS family permease